MNCKPGDLAFLSSDCVAEGAIVEVLRSAGLSAGGLPAWHCRSRTPIECTTERTRRDVSRTEFVVEDCYLRQISGVPVTDNISGEVTI